MGWWWGGSFSPTSPLNINSASFLQTRRCLWVFFSIQNTEGHVVQEICINVVRGGQLLSSETPCPLSHFHYRRGFTLMVNLLAPHYNAQLGGFFSTDEDLSISNRVLPAVAAWQIHHSVAKLATSWRKVSDAGEPNTL